MISYKEYKMLIESEMPSVNLGVQTPSNIGGLGNTFGFTPVDASEDAEELMKSLEEAKKKMFGDEMVDPKNAPPKDKDLDSEEDAEMASKDNDDDDDDSCGDNDSDDLAMMKKCGKKCGKKSKKEEVEGEEATLEEAKKMAKQKKKCGGEMGDMGDMDDMDDDDMDDAKDKKDLITKGADNNIDSDDDDDDKDMDDEDTLEMMKKSKKEQADFYDSLGIQLQGEPKQNKDGISEYLEDAVFTPANVNGNLVSDPAPGEVGFAPEGKLGSVGSYQIGTNEQQDLSSDFMSDWEIIKDLAFGVRDNF